MSNIFAKRNNSFGARSPIRVGSQTYEVFRLDALARAGLNIERLPFALRILLENLLRNEDGKTVTADDIRRLAQWNSKKVPEDEISFSPARVLLQDFTGVPAVVDLAAMRDAMARMGGDPKQISPLQPVELVIDHSVQVDAYGSADALYVNAQLEFERNRERYLFLRWGQQAFSNFKVVPPDTGIVHQINLEYLARVVFATKTPEGRLQAYPDTLVGTDSHTTMINGLGVLGWGVGGIEAEAAMLGQPVSMLIPQVLGVRLVGTLPEGSTATDLVLTVTELLRRHGVVGMFVEFFGPGLASLPLADRATIANMSPEYGATCGLFPVDEETLRYLRFTGRSEEQIALVEAYLKEQGLFYRPDSPEPDYSQTLPLDLNTIEPSLAGPKRPQDRLRLSEAKEAFHKAIRSMVPLSQEPNGPKMVQEWEAEGGKLPHNPVSPGREAAAALLEASEVRCTLGGQRYSLRHGSIVIAAITSCTNTSNPSVMIAAGLLAKKAAEHGLKSAPWVKTSLAPGSKVVTDYLRQAGLMPYLEQLGFHLVGYGCTTCIGNSGHLPSEVSQAITTGSLIVCSVLSGNRNFEGRINPEVRANYLMSPPLVVAFAIAGRMDIDLLNESLGADPQGRFVFLRDIWPSQHEVQKVIGQSVQAQMFRETYREVFEGDDRWSTLQVPTGDRFVWDVSSTYIRRVPYFDQMTQGPSTHMPEITGARVLALLGESITTDHISPAGNIKKDSPAGRYLIEQGVDPKDFNSYGARRGNHEVMVRGTFANIRLRNQLAPGTEGGFTTYLPTGEVTSIYDAAMKYQTQGIPLIVLAGKEYGSGSSRDWAAKGPALLGVRAVIAESFERIHRSNLVGMGILPLQFQAGHSVKTLGLTGRETFDILGLSDCTAQGTISKKTVSLRAHRETSSPIEFSATLRIDTPQELLYFLHGGILPFVLRQLLSNPE